MLVYVGMSEKNYDAKTNMVNFLFAQIKMVNQNLLIYCPKCLSELTSKTSFHLLKNG